MEEGSPARGRGPWILRVVRQGAHMLEAHRRCHVQTVDGPTGDFCQALSVSVREDIGALREWQYSVAGVAVPGRRGIRDILELPIGMSCC